MKKKVYLIGWHAFEISGTATVFREIVKALPSSNTLDFEIILPREPKASDQSMGNLPFRVISHLSHSHTSWLNGLTEKLELDDQTLLFFPSLHLPENINFPFVSLIHDVLPLHQIDYLLNPFLRFQFLTQLRKHRSAKKIVTVSHFSKQDILRCLKVPEKKIEVIYNGVSPLFAQKKIISKSTISNYILYVGDLRKRKNVLTLAKAYLALPIQLQNKYPFVFTGEGEQKKKIIQLFKQKKTLAFLHSIGKVSEEELPKWYQNAELFVFPSLFEGFGLPIVEAQKSGIPVICGKNSSLPEIAGKGALITDVRNPKSLTEAMYKILTDENFKKKLTDLGTANAERFSWEQTASQYVKVFADIFNNDFKN